MTPYDAAFSELPREAKQAVHNVLALAFGSGRAGSGLSRIGDVIGEWRLFQPFSVWMTVPRSCLFMAGWVRGYMTCLKVGTCAVGDPFGITNLVG